MLVVKRKLVQKNEKRGLKFPNEQTIKGLNEEDTSDKVKYDEIKDIEKTEYKKRTRMILEANLSRILIKGINIWTTALLRYSAAFLDWTKFEKEELKKNTRKLLTMHNVLHPKSHVDRLYLPRD